jgi:hypothetical protein
MQGLLKGAADGPLMHSIMGGTEVFWKLDEMMHGVCWMDGRSVLDGIIYQCFAIRLKYGTACVTPAVLKKTPCCATCRIA